MYLKTVLLFICLFLAGVSAQAQKTVPSFLNIVPQPKSVTPGEGEFRFSAKTKIFYQDAQTQNTAGLLNDFLQQNYGFRLETTNKQPKRDFIAFTSEAMPNGAEAYALDVTKNEIRVKGSQAGLFYGLQTFLQMLPINLKSSEEAQIAAVSINDAPRFKYRGMHLDVTRHFFPVSFVKKYIDLMAMYKFNNFHWHLTDDQGWRIEIKKYPRLTEVGSKRRESTKERNVTPYVGDGIPVEGFYTQEQIKEVVAYAKSRFINVIPEIEIPGHAVAALAAYPELGCKENATYQVHTNWGITSDIFCPKEETFKFLEDVLTEVIALFPDSPYIHTGGDEAPKDVWKASLFVQDLKKRLNLKDEHEVQSYFVQRIEKFVNSKGKRIIGWDEILEGGLAPNATVMSWRGEKGGIEAARQKHDVIMTPTDYLYLDYGQGDTQFEPINIGNQVSLERVYSYNPVPKELSAEDAQYILGAQGNIWTEYIKTPEKVEYMAFPRVIALSEVVWSQLAAKDFADFTRRLPFQLKRLDRLNVAYRIPEPAGLRSELVTSGNKVRVDWKAFGENSKIFYTLDGSTPTINSTEYKAPFEIDLEKNIMRQAKLIVVLPNGRQSSIYAATYLRRPLVKSKELTESVGGVRFQIFKGSFDTIRQLDTASAAESGTTKSVMLPQFLRRSLNPLKEDFGVIFDGNLFVPTDGIYEFQLESDDGAGLIIGEELVVDNDGAHTMQTRYGIVPLQKGFHKIRLKYFQKSGDSGLNLRWGLKGQGLKRIYGSELYQ